MQEAIRMCETIKDNRYKDGDPMAPFLGVFKFGNNYCSPFSNDS